MTSPRVLAVEHQESCPPALFGDWLVEAGCVLQVARPYLGEHLPDLTSYDAVVVLGGEMSANDDADVAWLAPLKQQLREAVTSGTPLLGICLGHQLLATALGGSVARNPRGQTVGLQPVGWTDAAGDDALVGGHTGTERGIHWNGDVVVEAPEGTVVLARDPAGELQVARFGQVAWGIQAHPEADTDVVRRWAESDRADHLELGIDQDAALTAITDARCELETHWRPCAQQLARLAGART